MNNFERPRFGGRDDEHSEGTVVGGEVITPTAVSIEDARSPDGSISTAAAWERGWLVAIARAYGRRDIAEQVRKRNVQDIVDAAKDAGLSRDVLASHLKSLGITVVPRQE